MYYNDDVLGFTKEKCTVKMIIYKIIDQDFNIISLRPLTERKLSIFSKLYTPLMVPNKRLDPLRTGRY